MVNCIFFILFYADLQWHIHRQPKFQITAKIYNS